MSRLNRIKQFLGSFQSRIFIAFTLLTLLIAIAFMIIMANNEIQHYRKRSQEKARLLATILADSVKLPLFSGDVATLKTLADTLLETPQVAHVVITDHDKRVLVERFSKYIHSTPSDMTTEEMPVHATASTPSVDSALSGGPAAQSPPFGSVRVSIDTRDLKLSIRNTLLKTGAVVLVFWLAVLAATYPILKRITRSFDVLTQGLGTMMEGDFSLKIPVESDDEAGRATQAVNRLASALEEREIENRNLQAELVSALQLEIQEEKRKFMAKMIQTNRMTSLGLLISSMAHNINTPNGAIKLAGHYIQRSWKDLLPILEGVTKDEGDFQVGGLQFSEAKTEFSSAAESMCRNAERVERVIQDLRAYNVGERSAFAPGVSVNQAVEGALTIVRAHGSQAQVKIVHRLVPDLPTITGNQNQIEQVVVNLLLNAMQASPGNGEGVTITTCHIPSQQEIQIIVMDEGEGLPELVAQNLFKPFTSTRIDKGGSGLGLYISNFIITEHKGRIEFSSNSPQGTIVTVCLPVMPAGAR